MNRKQFILCSTDRKKIRLQIVHWCDSDLESYNNVNINKEHIDQTKVKQRTVTISSMAMLCRFKSEIRHECFLREMSSSTHQETG